MTFRVGMKVVCVDMSEVNEFWGGENRPKLHGVYTIRSTFISNDDGVTPAVLLVEITNPLAWSGRECGFRASRFRPAVSRKTDISIFTEMLTPKVIEVVT